MLGILVCFLSLWDFLIFIVAWTIWLAEYIGGLYYLIIIPHRKMYRLKIRRGWVKESSRRLVRIDTSVSAASDRLAVDWKWHLPVIILTAATVFFVLGMDQRYGMDPAELEVVWIMYGSWSGHMCLVYGPPYRDHVAGQQSIQRELRYQSVCEPPDKARMDVGACIRVGDKRSGVDIYGGRVLYCRTGSACHGSMLSIPSCSLSERRRF